MPEKMIYPNDKNGICELCGDEFLIMHSKQRFCSLVCAANSNQKSKHDTKVVGFNINKDVLKVMRAYCQMHQMTYSKFVEEAISQALLLKGIDTKSVIEKVT